MIQNKLYIYITIVVVVVAALITQYVKIQKLNSEVANLKTALLYSEISVTKLEENNRELNKSIFTQNEAIEKMAIDKSKVDAEYASWKAKPAEVKYEVIREIREVESNDCEDIKNVLDSVKSIDFNSLQ